MCMLTLPYGFPFDAGAMNEFHSTLRDDRDRTTYGVGALQNRPTNKKKKKLFLSMNKQLAFWGTLTKIGFENVLSGERYTEYK